jgi:hypothetical protein
MRRAGEAIKTTAGAIRRSREDTRRRGEAIRRRGEATRVRMGEGTRRRGGAMSEAGAGPTTGRTRTRARITRLSHSSSPGKFTLIKI